MSRTDAVGDGAQLCLDLWLITLKHAPFARSFHVVEWQLDRARRAENGK